MLDTIFWLYCHCRQEEGWKKMANLVERQTSRFSIDANQLLLMRLTDDHCMDSCRKGFTNVTSKKKLWKLQPTA